MDNPGITGLIFDAMDSLDEEYNIDDKRRYVVGMSLGGYGSWYLIGAKPEKFAAAIPVSGGGNPAMASKMTDIPIWAFHGAYDKAVPVDLTRNMIEAIEDAGGNPKYTEFSAGHLIWGKVRDTPGVVDWLFAQKKN
jgi:predicted peptidase